MANNLLLILFDCLFWPSQYFLIPNNHNYLCLIPINLNNFLLIPIKQCIVLKRITQENKLTQKFSIIFSIKNIHSRLKMADLEVMKGQIYLNLSLSQNS